MSVRGLNHADTPCSELWQSATQIAWWHHEPCPSRPSVRRSLKAFYLVTEQYDAVEIAAAVGFCNVNQFTNSFKTANGITPTQYRQLPRTILPERKDLAIARSANE